MRISDWSSDVCSSDLASGANGGTTSSNTGYLRPDNFYVAGEADKMVQGLRSAFENIIEETVGSSGSFAAHTTKLETGAMTRSEERRVGKECVSTCRSRWWPYQ